MLFGENYRPAIWSGPDVAARVCVRRWISNFQPMNGEPYLSKTEILVPSHIIPSGLGKIGRTPSNLIFIDLPNEAPDISPTEKVQISASERDSGKSYVKVDADRFEGALRPGIPPETLLSGPSYYLTEAGVRAIRRNTIDAEYAAWRLARLSSPEP
jgi:hypothetical protein